MLKNYYITKTTYRLLKDNISMRDNYLLLCKEIHNNEMNLLGFKKEDYYDLVFEEKLSNVQTIVRIWRALQEKCPELRGAEWEERQRNGGKIRAEIAEENALFRQLKLF